MNYIFHNTLNTRSILQDSLQFIRSDVPTVVSEEEKLQLLANDITTIVDLRTDAERNRKPCPLIEDNRFVYHCMPVTTGDTVPQCAADVEASYIGMVDAQMKNIIDCIRTAPSNVLYFCNAGKDRTGVVSAILLHKAGMSAGYIIGDYMKSKENLKDMLIDFAKQNPAVSLDVIIPHECYMEEFLKWFAKNETIV